MRRREQYKWRVDSKLDWEKYQEAGRGSIYRVGRGSEGS